MNDVQIIAAVFASVFIVVGFAEIGARGVRKKPERTSGQKNAPVVRCLISALGFAQHSAKSLQVSTGFHPAQCVASNTKPVHAMVMSDYEFDRKELIGE